MENKQAAVTSAEKLYKQALGLGIFTVAYNILEGLVSVAFGSGDETLALFGFGIDSFIEVISGLGIIWMIRRIRANPDTPAGQFEKTALRITGGAFFALSALLVAMAVISVFQSHHPKTTLAGAIISGVSILVMWALVAAKRKVGRALKSKPILADAQCTMVCIWMSVVVLASSLIFQFTGFGLVDALGALGLVWFCLAEGREAFEKAKGRECSCGHDECGA